MALRKDVLSMINEQIWLENNSSFFYLKLSIEFANNGYNGISKFFLDQSNEEREHMLKLIQYVIDREETPTLPQYNYMEEKDEVFDVLKHFKDSLFQERQVTSSVQSILSKAREHNDVFTEDLMVWYVKEQFEEETKFLDIIDKISILKDDLWKLDEELSN
jgi:ferritin